LFISPAAPVVVESKKKVEKKSDKPENKDNVDNSNNQRLPK
jgi:hypothetical protein